MCWATLFEHRSECQTVIREEQDRNENIDTPGHFSTAEKRKKETVYHGITCCSGSCTPNIVSFLREVEAIERKKHDGAKKKMRAFKKMEEDAAKSGASSSKGCMSVQVTEN